MGREFINEKFPFFLQGGDYNPDQWQNYPEVLEEDMRLMKLANCNEMSVGIFAWASLEPSEGVFNFDFLDKAINDIYKNGGRVILATPSGARPRWMADKYPEVLRVNGQGEREHFKTRHNHCFSSPVYREKVRIINTKLAERYGKHPAVIGWHISNEYNGECYCPLCTENFRKYLKKKFHNDINELNHAYWTYFWSHNYDSFDQIEPPSGMAPTDHMGLAVDWRRFTSEMTADFMAAEIAPLKEICPDIPVTTNMMGAFYGLDYRKFRDVIDFASTDNYPTWHSGNQQKTAVGSAFGYDLIRCLKYKPFVLMENTPSNVNWHEYNKLMRPGMETLSSFQAVAHGSDSILYFQFRKGRGGTEKFHGAVVDHLGTEETRVFKTVRRKGEILRKVNEICGTSVESQVAVIFDWDCMWAIDDCAGFSKRTKRYRETSQAYYEIFWKRGINCDIISSHDDLSQYKLVVAPMQYMTDKETIENFTGYVKNGGTLYATYTLGMVDENDLCYLGGFPGGGLKDVFGIWNEEIDTLYPNDTNFSDYNGEKHKLIDYCELIHPRGAEVLATYGEDFYKGMPIITRNKYGQGQAYYQAARDAGSLSDTVISEIIEKLGIRSATGAKEPLGFAISAHERTDGKTKYVFVENYSGNDVSVPLGRAMLDMINDTETDVCRLEAFGLGIFKYEEQI
ncbi:MAG: beta-galactosidase [Clostridia bacterium]|nr:beta-galactosidase [Clostridia bacterium]